MEAIGTLAGRIAHDFNNILSSIMGYTEIALYAELDKEHPAYHSLNKVLKASRLAKDLVKQTTGEAVAVQKAQEISPDEVIPMDDDFKDF